VLARRHHGAVAYDEDLAERVKELVGADHPLTERRMFGGLAFLIGGHMAVGVSRDGGIIVRVDPEATDQIVATTVAEPMVMRGRPARGWLRVAAEHVRTKRQLQTWVRRGVASAAALPPKPRSA
jgi:TfoX/Sxy family transcriptional regulator of competence genes